MMTKRLVCKYDGTCSLIRESEEVLQRMPIWINKYVTDTDQPLNPPDYEQFSYETSIYHSKDLSQYPKLNDDISKNKNVRYSIVAIIEQKNVKCDLNRGVTRGKLKIIISNIEPKDLTHATIASKNNDVNIIVVD